MSAANDVDGRQELQLRLQSFVGRKGATAVAPDPVNAAMIRHWCVALGDLNPVYRDEDFARTTVHGGVVAPPAMLQAWTMPGYGGEPVKDVVSEIYDYLDAQGYVGIVATNSEQDYLRSLRLGDRISATKTVASISEVKTTGLGEGVFVTTNIDIVDNNGELVGRQLHRVLKYKPDAAKEKAALSQNPETNASTAAKETARRPRPNVTADVKFFFEGAKQRKLLIQCCQDCQTLQHPPTAACAACGSYDLYAKEMSGAGTLYSFTTVHAPVVPPFKPPYVVALVELREGVRVVSELPDIEPAEVSIGMELQVDFLACDDDLTLPVFRPARARDRTARANSGT